MSIEVESVAMPASIVDGSPVMLHCKTIGSVVVGFAVVSAEGDWILSAGFELQPTERLNKKTAVEMPSSHLFIQSSCSII
ncbi:hypothetical protein YSY22_37770 [Brevibacillus formosus]